MLIARLSLILIVLRAVTLTALDVTADHFDKTFNVGPKSRIIVRNPDGVTRITSAPGSQVKVDVTKLVLRAKDEESAKKNAEKVSVLITQTGSVIEARVDYPHFNFGIHINEPEVRVEMVITAPPDVDLQASAGDGTLDATGFSDGDYSLTISDGEMTVNDCSGRLELRGSDGKMHLKALQGNIDARLSDGSLDAERVSGDVRFALGDGRLNVAECSGTLDFSVRDGEMRTSDCSGNARISATDGKVYIQRYRGGIEATASDGRLELSGVLDSVNARTGDGTIKITAEDGSMMKENWNLQSRDGDIFLNLPSTFEGSVDFSTSDGHITTNVPVTIVGSLSTNHLTGSIRQNGNQLRIHTTDGDISVQGK